MNRYLLIICAFIGFQLHAIATTYSAANLATGSDGVVEVIPLEAAVSDSPATIQIKTYAPGTFSIYRKSPSETTWGNPIATGVSLAAGGVWSDTSVSSGTLYEYKFSNTGAAPSSGVYPTGYILTGIKVDQTQTKGRMALVVASDVPASLPAEYAQYKSDLVADGWTVHEIQCPKASNYMAFVGTLSTVKVNAGGAGSTSGTVYLRNSAGQKAVANLTTSSGVITGVSILSGGGGEGFSVGDSLVVAGGSSVGTGASVTAIADASNSPLTGAFAVTGGGGYTDGETVTLKGKTSGATAQCTLSVSDGVVYGFDIVSSSTTFTNGELLTMSGNTSGTGIGNLVAYTTSGSLVWVFIYSPGSGYVTGDVGIMTGETSGKTAVVSVGAPNGYIYSVAIKSSQNGFINGERLTISGLISGSGAGEFVAAANSGPLVGVTVNAGGSGYIDQSVVRLVPSGTQAQAAVGVLSASNGVITGITVTKAGSNVANGAVLALNDVQSKATGYNLTVQTVSSPGAAMGVAVSAGGSGYRDNDSATITGQTSGATAVGSIIAPSGAITAVSVVLPSAFTAGESLTITPANGGSEAVATAGPVTESFLLVRSAVQALYNAYPGELVNLGIVGKVPLCWSGIYDVNGPDGHGNTCPYGTDAFYADMDGVVGIDWTDAAETTLKYVGYSVYNLAGDKRFDQQNISQVANGKVELGYGRMDFSFGFVCEMEAMRSFFNKLHRYKISSPDFQPGRRACDRYGYPNVRETALMSAPSIVGFNNIDATVTSNLSVVDSNGDADAVYSAANGPYLFYFKGSNSPGDGTGGRAVIWTGMQSHYGFWYNQMNVMQEALAQDSYALSWTWDIWGLRYIYHRLGMGCDMADMMKQSINNQGWLPAGPYTYRFNSTNNGDFHGTFLMAHTGDPAMRLFMVPPPTRLSVVKSGDHPALSWTASTDSSVIGYHVYRKPSGNGPYTRITSSPVAATAYADSTVASGAYTYMVRAVRLETTGGGTYYNPSLGVEQSFDLDSAPATVAITTLSLADGNWNTAYSQTLAAQGGVPQYTWSLASGSLPSGLSLSPLGVISGVPTAAGVFTFAVQATDQASVSVQKTLTINVNSDATVILIPEATAYTTLSSTSSNYGMSETNAIGGSGAVETFQRYNLSGVSLNNGFIKATLRLYVTPDTKSGVVNLIQANLVADSQDGWVESSRTVPFSTAYANNGAGFIRLTSANHGFATGNPVTIAGFTPTTPNGMWNITVVDQNHFDIPVAYSASYTVTSASAYATSSNIVYTNRPTLFNTGVPTLSATTCFPVLGQTMDIDVTQYVRNELANDPAKLLTLRLFSAGTSTAWVGSRRAYGVAQPRLMIESSDAPAISLLAPTVNPVYVYAGSGLKIDSTVTPIPSRAESLSLAWTQVSGPGTAAFSNTSIASPSVTFSATGSYVLRLTASDGVLQSTKEINVVVMPSIAGVAATTGANNGLLLRLPLDQTSDTAVTDLSGVSPANSAVLTNFGSSGNAVWNGTGGKVGGALSFNGDSQYVEVTDTAANPLDGMQKLSVSVWVNTSSSDSYSHALVVKRASASSTSQNSYSVSLDSSRHVVASIYNQAAITSASTLTVGQWAHVVVVFDGSLSSNNLQIFINGLPDKFGTVTGLTGNVIPRNTTSTSKLRIGSFYSTALTDSTMKSFYGMMDEVRLYNRALSVAEIQDLYAAVPSNTGPIITLASTSVSANAGQSFALNATVTDDGLPNPLQTGWTQVAGFGTISFVDAAAASTSATADIGGVYTLRITASDGAITTFADLAANIAEILTPYQQWLRANGLPTDGSGTGTPTATPLNDGVNNALKYALGLSSDTRGYGGRLVQGIKADSGHNYLTLSYTKPEPAPSGVAYTVETSPDLVNWSAADTVEVSDTVSSDGLSRTTTVRDTQPMGGTASKRFIRLEVVVP